MKSLISCIVLCFTHASRIRQIYTYVHTWFEKLKCMYYSSKSKESNESNYRFTKTVFIKIPKQHLSIRKRERLVEELKLMSRMEPILPDLFKIKLMNMAEPYPENANFFNFILDLTFEIISEKVNDFLNLELETFSEDDMVYIPIRVDSELFSDDELMLTCNFCEYNDIPFEKKNTIFQNIWVECRLKYGSTIFSGETMGLYTAEVKSLQLIFLLVTDCLEEVELKSNAKWETIPIVVNTYSTTVKDINAQLTDFPWIIHYKRKRWQIMYAGTRPISS